MVKFNGAQHALNNETDNEKARQLLIQAIEQGADIDAWLLKALRDGRLKLNVAKKGRKSDYNHEAYQFALDAAYKELKQESYVAEMEEKFGFGRTKSLEYRKDANEELKQDN